MTGIRVACIGAGYWGANLVRTLHQLGALQWIVETAPERRAFLADEYPHVELSDSVERVLADPAIQGVVIATPAVTHGDLVRRALLADKDVLVEKPFCLSAAEGRSLTALAASRGRVLMIGHLLQYHPSVLRLRELVESGDLGRLRYIYSHRLNLGKIRREESVLWSLAPHDISVILGLTGSMPERVEVASSSCLQEGVADSLVGLLTFPEGVQAHLFVSWLHPFKEQRLVVVGERQMAVFDDQKPDQKLLLYPHRVEWRDGIPVASKADAIPVPCASTEPLRAECQHFLDRIADRGQPRTDGMEGVRVLTVLEACDAAMPRQRPTPPSFEVHPSSYVDEEVEIGSGTKIWHFSHILHGSRIGANCRIGQNVVIGPNVSVGDGVKIQNNVSVYEGVTMEDDVFCGPSVVFTNVHNPRSHTPRMHELRSTLVRRGATLGANATIRCGAQIGAHAFVGAGAVVLQDVPDFALVVGNPGRQIGWVCRCGERLRFEAGATVTACAACNCQYRQQGSVVTLE